VYPRQCPVQCGSVPDQHCVECHFNSGETRHGISGIHTDPWIVPKVTCTLIGLAIAFLPNWRTSWEPKRDSTQLPRLRHHSAKTRRLSRFKDRSRRIWTVVPPACMRQMPGSRDHSVLCGTDGCCGAALGFHVSFVVVDHCRAS
jgi:hypothetical protein